MSASTDSRFSQRMFGMSLGGVTHPILSDYHPKGKVASEWGIYNEESGLAKRAAFIVDKHGVVRYKQIYSGSLPDIEDLLKQLDAIK